MVYGFDGSREEGVRNVSAVGGREGGAVGLDGTTDLRKTENAKMSPTHIIYYTKVPRTCAAMSYDLRPGVHNT